MTRVDIDHKLIRWARERAGRERSELAAKFKKLPEWEEGKIQPTLKQAEAFARAVNLPFGYLFLTEPPEERVPIQDFRRISGEHAKRPSPNLLDTVYACQERQDWYRDFAQSAGESNLEFVGSVTMRKSPKEIAAKIREELHFEPPIRCSTWDEALRNLIHCSEDAGVLVMASGIVGNNNHRPLIPAEFRGFALSDKLAPLIFVNGADTKAAQKFTLAHELAHLWLGKSALGNSTPTRKPAHRNEEAWCNAVAAELLVPLAKLGNMLNDDETLHDALARLTQTFKVSSQVILLRLLDIGWINQKDFDVAWEQAINLPSLPKPKSGGGNFHRTVIARVGRRFARAVVGSALEGRTLYRDAFRMLGVSKTKTFNEFGRQFGLIE